MKIIRTLDDVDRSGLSERAQPVVRDLVTGIADDYAQNGHRFNPDEDGHVLLVEKGDTDGDIRAALGATLLDAVIEGCVLDRGHFITLILFNNQFGVSVVVEDAPWLPAAVRARLANNL